MKPIWEQTLFIEKERKERRQKSRKIQREKVRMKEKKTREEKLDGNNLYIKEKLWLAIFCFSTITRPTIHWFAISKEILWISSHQTLYSAESCRSKQIICAAEAKDELSNIPLQCFTLFHL